MNSPFDQLKTRGSAFAVFCRQMLIAAYQVDPGEPVPVRQAQVMAVEEVKRLGGSMAVATISVYTATLKKMKLLKSVRMPLDKSHFGIVLTDLGAETLEKLVEHDKNWGTTLASSKIRAGLTESQQEALLDRLLQEGHHRIPYIDPKERTAEQRTEWRVLFDEFKKGNLKIIFAEQDLEMIPNE